jgi:hypothetical protein
MLNGEIDKYANLADKYKVRDFVERRGLKHILPELHGVWSDANEIDFNCLPERFVLKCNNGSGYNVLCTDKMSLDVTTTVTKLNTWLNSVYNPVEAHYRLIEPRILCEEFISDDQGRIPNDFKFFCFNGKPHCVLVCLNRWESLGLATMDVNWRRLDYIRTTLKSDVVLPKPKNFEIMLEYSARLSEGFDFVRVDLYDTGNRVYFGELTFTPHQGLLGNFSDAAINIMGELMRDGGDLAIG